MKNARLFLLLFLSGLLAGCVSEEKPGPERAHFAPADFSDLDGWQNDDHVAALGAFRHSCGAFAGKPLWKAVCAEAPQGTDENAARLYFETYFQPYAVASNTGREGLFTGYYVPELNGSLNQGGAFQTPLYARPADLISADLGLFKSELKGQHIVGKVQGTNFIPYDKRSEIAQGALANRATALAWVDDPVSAFFLEVQGSGRLKLPDGTIFPVGYDGANGRAYTAIGRVMSDRGDLPKPVTMPAIRAWLRAHPYQAQQVMDENASYVFFRHLPNDDIIGAEGVALTAQRSLAIDPAYLPLGAPVWLEVKDGQGAPLRRLMVAQDTGGAIKGPVRGDVFWGAGDDAARQAGSMQSPGRYFVLLPKGVDPDAR